MPNKKRIPTGLEPLDSFCGGYSRGGICVVRALDKDPDALQDYYMSQVKDLAIDRGLSVLVASLGFSAREFVKCIADGEGVTRLQRLAEARIYVSEYTKGETLESFTEDLMRRAEEYESDVIFIEGLEKYAPEGGGDCSGTVDAVLGAVRKNRCAAVLIDFDDNLPVPYPREEDVMEIELKTTLDEVVQANIYAGSRMTTATDLYGRWRIFENILRKDTI